MVLICAGVMLVLFISEKSLLSFLGEEPTNGVDVSLLEPIAGETSALSISESKRFDFENLKIVSLADLVVDDADKLDGFNLLF